MTDKVDQWVWYVDTKWQTKKIRKIKLKSLLHSINTDHYYSQLPRMHFATGKSMWAGPTPEKNKK